MKGVLFFTLVAGLRGQVPDVYTVFETSALFGKPVNVKIYRNGSKAVIEKENDRRRTLYDFASGQTLSWDAVDRSVLCTGARFSGDWGDPFMLSFGLFAEMKQQNARQVGTERLKGFAANVFETSSSEGKAKIWVEPKTGLILKFLVMPVSGPTITRLEVTDVRFAPPAASVFTPAASCAAVSSGPRTLTEGERIAAETGGNAQDFAMAIKGPASKDSCTVVFRIVRPGSMEKVTSGFQVAVDLTADADHPAKYTTGLSATAHATFSGGGIREMTPQLRNGVLRIENAPATFHIEAIYPAGGSGDALIYRQCFAPRTVLLFVLKNPDKRGVGGDWLWVKSGKYATAP